MPVRDTGGPISVPVGKALLGRMLNALGEPIDRKAPLGDLELRSIHRPPVPLSRRGLRAEIFATGIKSIDLLSRLERGGKAGLFGGAGVGKTVLIPEMIHNMGRPVRGGQPVLRHRRVLPRGRGALSRDAERRRA
jgi:F-type H+-transporting ATPase subunit beta